MLRYLSHRLLEAAVVLLAMSFLIYLLLGLMPGDPIDLMASGDPNITERRSRPAEGGLRPRPAACSSATATGCRAALGGDFGYSRLYALPVTELMAPRLGNTALLMGLSFALALIIALPAGVLAAVRPRSWLDYGLNLFAFAGISVPSFWLALLMILLFAVTLGWLPASGVHAVGNDTLGSRALHLVLPVLTLTLLTVGGVLRFTRSAMLETLRAGLHPHGARQGPGRRGAWSWAMRCATP